MDYLDLLDDILDGVSGGSGGSGDSGDSGGFNLWDYITDTGDDGLLQDILPLLPILVGGGSALGWFDPDQDPVGYQGTVERKQAIREQVPHNRDPDRLPGAYGQRYFTDTQFVDPNDAEAVAAAQATADQQVIDLNKMNHRRARRLAELLERLKNPSGYEGAPLFDPAGNEPLPPQYLDPPQSPAPAPAPGTGGGGPYQYADLPEPPQQVRPLDAILSGQNLPSGGIAGQQPQPQPQQPAPTPARPAGMQSYKPIPWPDDMAAFNEEFRKYDTPWGNKFFDPLHGANDSAFKDAVLYNASGWSTDPNTGEYVLDFEKIARNNARRKGLTTGGFGFAGGGHVGGIADGMADQIPAMINGQQPAALSGGEFVVPADVVSGIGNGNTNAGVAQLENMMDRVRHARTGRRSQGRAINPNKFMPG